jgi:crossover junction endonuclease EME1
MLQEVQGVTPSAAAGIRAEFESFKVLMDAFERAERKGGRERGEALLQDCEVKLRYL